MVDIGADLLQLLAIELSSLLVLLHHFEYGLELVDGLELHGTQVLTLRVSSTVLETLDCCGSSPVCEIFVLGRQVLEARRVLEVLDH